MINIRKITALEVIPVRHLVLRIGKPIETCTFDGDNLPTTVHIGLYNDENLSGVVSLFKANTKLFSLKNQFQIRGMAVLKESQKKGFGDLLIQNAEEFCSEEKTDLIWFNARQEATGFYKKMGYKIKGKPFEITGVGEHVVMYKELK